MRSARLSVSWLAGPPESSWWSRANSAGVSFVRSRASAKRTRDRWARRAKSIPHSGCLARVLVAARVAIEIRVAKDADVT